MQTTYPWSLIGLLSWANDLIGLSDWLIGPMTKWRLPCKNMSLKLLSRWNNLISQSVTGDMSSAQVIKLSEQDNKSSEQLFFLNYLVRTTYLVVRTTYLSCLDNLFSCSDDLLILCEQLIKLSRQLKKLNSNVPSGVP